MNLDYVLEVDGVVNYPIEFLTTLDLPGILPHILCLEVGTPVILLPNFNPPKISNSTRLQVKALHKHVIEATIFTGVNQGETLFIPRIPLIPSDYQFEFKCLQFPAQLCYAVTINKAQGQTLKVAGVDLRNDSFSHGQLYVACSRVNSPNSLVILQPEKKREILFTGGTFEKIEFFGPNNTDQFDSINSLTSNAESTDSYRPMGKRGDFTTKNLSMRNCEWFSEDIYYKAYYANDEPPPYEVAGDS